MRAKKLSCFMSALLVSAAMVTVPVMTSYANDDIPIQSETQSDTEEKIPQNDIVGDDLEEEVKLPETEETAENSTSTKDFITVDKKPSVPEQLPEFDGTENLVFAFNPGSGQYEIKSVTRISISSSKEDVSNVSSTSDYGCNVDELDTENLGSFDYVYDLNKGTITLNKNGIISNLFALWTYDSHYIEVYYQDMTGTENKLTFNLKVVFLQHEVTLPDNKTIMSKEDMQALLAINKTQSVIIKNKNGISFTFYPGNLRLAEDNVNYDFGAEIITDFNQIPNGILTKDEFAFRINYNYSGQLPGTATISIPVNSQWIGKTLYYYQINNDGTCQYQMSAVVDKNSNYTISQNHCSDYLATTKAPDDNGNIPKQEISNSETTKTNTDNSSDSKINKTENVSATVSAKASPKTGDVNTVAPYLLAVLGACFIIYITVKHKLIRKNL